MRNRTGWHVEAENSSQGLYLRCTVCGESEWIVDAGIRPQQVANFVVSHDHGRSAG